MRGLSPVLLLCALGFGQAHSDAQECPAEHSAKTVAYEDSVDAQTTHLTPQRDGSVQATDAKSGATLWVFTPPDAESGSSGDRLTDLRVLRFDANGDGTINLSDGDKVWLYFGTRAAGPFYYALDISTRDRPRLLWKASVDSLDGLSDAWSTPTIARIRVGGASQNGEHFVLVFGGGYGGALTGNRIFIVDAASGRLLWSAGANDGTREPDFVSDDMTDAFAARVAVIDTDGDDFADRMYAVDVTGHVWRFDISNGQPRSSLVKGGVFADLTDEGGLFLNGPDVALIQPLGAAPYYNVAVASTRPGVFYSIRDRDPSTWPVRPGDLAGIDAAGWKIALTAGESSVAESVTADGVVLFTTFQPTSDGACTVGVSRVYAVSIDSGTATLDLNDDGEVNAADLSKQIEGTEPSGEPRVASSRTDSPRTITRTWWQRPAVK